MAQDRLIVAPLKLPPEEVEERTCTVCRRQVLVPVRVLKDQLPSCTLLFECYPCVVAAASPRGFRDYTEQVAPKPRET